MRTNERSPEGEPVRGSAAASIRRKRFTVSIAWVVPIVAALVGFGLLYRSVIAAGPEIEIRFHDASGIEVGGSLKYHGVDCGRIERIEIGDDSLDDSDRYMPEHPYTTGA